MLDESVPLIWNALGDDRVTTKEAAERLEELFQYKCPDDLAKKFNRLKRQGLIKGEISMDLGGWVWWVDSECHTKGDE